MLWKLSTTLWIDPRYRFSSKVNPIFTSQEIRIANKKAAVFAILLQLNRKKKKNPWRKVKSSGQSFLKNQFFCFGLRFLPKLKKTLKLFWDKTLLVSAKELLEIILVNPQRVKLCFWRHYSHGSSLFLSSQDSRGKYSALLFRRRIFRRAWWAWLIRSKVDVNQHTQPYTPRRVIIKLFKKQTLPRQTADLLLLGRNLNYFWYQFLCNFQENPLKIFSLLLQTVTSKIKFRNFL